ncbi:MAG TPA: cytochrome c3 family protein, partial [Gemmatimonadales bacterium]|nr:cytochrome c3 family protein [Gemmatimonadales bacterium]
MSRAGLVRTAFLAAGVVLLAGAALLAEPFDHWEHRKLFLSCNVCHAGATGRGDIFPAAVSCATCHDGKVEEEVTWTPRQGPPPSNLRFAHDVHIREYAKEKGVAADSAAACAQCHNEKGAEYFRVKRALVGNCLDCHGVKEAHFDAPPETCAECHMPLTEAKLVPEARVATWKAPKNHEDPDFQTLHGELSGPVTVDGREFAASPSCATCHARNFCEACHLDGADVKSIAALGEDPRALALVPGEFKELKAPKSHLVAQFVRTHGHDVKGSSVKSCATCHTAESCQACHLVPPREVRLLPAATPTRRGAQVERERPEDHGRDFKDGHGPMAGASPQSCAGCHTLEQCVDCHRPSAASSGSYHPVDYLSRHPVAAYQRETS